MLFVWPGSQTSLIHTARDVKVHCESTMLEKGCCNLFFVSAGGYESFQAHYPELCTEAKPAQERNTPDTLEVQPGTDYTQVKPDPSPLK